MAYTVSLSTRAEREALIKKRVETSAEFGEKIYDFRSDTYTPKVISVPISLPVYRMENCRTFSAQHSAIAKKGLDKDFFDNGQELTTAQQAQHDILIKLAETEKEGSVAKIMDVLSKDGQREPILITSTGVVVNGNRRLCAMRELMRRKDGSVDERFTNIRCAVLPPDVTRDEVDDIEADLQARPETKLEYDWIGDAHLIRRQVGKGRSTKAVADRLRRSKPDIDNVLLALDEADLYLSEWIERPGEYDRVHDGQQIFGDIPKSIAMKDANLQNASRAIAWSIYDNRNKMGGRVYRLNAAFGKLAPKVLEILEEQLDLADPDDDLSDGDDFDIDIDGDDDKDYTTIIEALRDETASEEVVPVLIEACETAVELDTGKRNEEAALKALSHINAKVKGVNVNAAGLKTLPAMLKQIESIVSGLTKIESAVKVRQSGLASGQPNEE